jgi:hypothetical protein
MIEAVENHMPQVIVIDEIGTAAEALAARTIAERGVQLIATAHGNTLENLLQNPTLSDLVGGIQTVTLSDEEARRRGTQKTVLERKAPPTFALLVEIQDKDRLAVHHDVAEVVDRLLRAIPPRPELRLRTEDGQVKIEQAERPPVPPRPAPPWGRAAEVSAFPAARTARGKTLRIFPYAVAKAKLDRAIRKYRVPALLVEDLDAADLIVTLKSQERRQPRRLREAVARGLPLHVVKSNTIVQMEHFVRETFAIEEPATDVDEELMLEVEQAVDRALENGRPVELSPQNSHLRRLQHQLVERYGLTSQSRGEEPFRRVVVFPGV